MAVVAVSLLYPHVIGNRLAPFLMLPVLAYTLWQFVDWVVPDAMMLLAFGGAGITVGFALFAAGLPISTANPQAFLQNSVRRLSRLLKSPENLSLLLFQAVFIVYEELIWRVFLTHALIPVMPTLLVILIAGTLFWFVHEENRTAGGHSIEFLLFSFALTALYIFTDSLLFVLMIHATRNLLILSGFQDAPSKSGLNGENV